MKKKKEKRDFLFWTWSGRGHSSPILLYFQHLQGKLEFGSFFKCIFFLSWLACSMELLYTADDTPKAPENSNCFTPSLSCAMHSLWASISLAEGNEGAVMVNASPVHFWRQSKCVCGQGRDPDKCTGPWGVSREVSNSFTKHYEKGLNTNNNT